MEGRTFLCRWCNRYYSAEDLDGTDDDGQPVCVNCSDFVHGRGESGEYFQGEQL